MVRVATGRPPSKRTYSMQENGRTREGYSGNMIFNQGMVRFKKPGWDGKVNTYRILPGLNPEFDPEHPTDQPYFDPFRLSLDPLGYGDWVRTYECVYSFGEPGLSFVLYDPRIENYPVQSHPCYLICSHAHAAVRNETGPHWQKWKRLTEYQQKRGRVIDWPKTMRFMNVMIFQDAGKVLKHPDGIAPGQPGVVLGLGTSAWECFNRMLNTPNPQADPAGDFASQFVYGDVVGLGESKGYFLQLYQKGTDPDASTVADRPVQARSVAAAVRSRQEEDSKKDIGYDGRLIKEFAGYSAEFLEEEVCQMIADTIKPWDTITVDGHEYPGIIRLMDEEQQISLLAKSVPPELMIEALEEKWKSAIPASVYDNYKAVLHNVAYGTQQQAGGWVDPATVAATGAAAPAAHRPAASGLAAAASGGASASPAAPVAPSGRAPAAFTQPQADVAAPPSDALTPPAVSVTPAQAFDPRPTGGEAADAEKTMSALAAARRKMKESKTAS